MKILKNILGWTALILIGFFFVVVLVGMGWHLPEIIKENWCYQPADWPWQMIRHDVAFSPEEFEKFGGPNGYVAVGVLYSNACESEFDFPEVVLYTIFPKTKQEWDQNKRQELLDLIRQSHEREIRVAFADPDLEINFESVVDGVNCSDCQSYFYRTNTGYLVEIDGFGSWMRNIRCEDCERYLYRHCLSASTPCVALTGEELEDVYIKIIQRINPIFTYNHWLETWEHYTIDKKGDNTFFRLNSKNQKRNDGTPAFIQIGLDQFGNLLNYTNQ